MIDSFFFWLKNIEDKTIANTPTTQHLILKISISHEQSTFEKYNNNTFDIHLSKKMIKMRIPIKI
jgi:hypothetical protein